jgi:hypothetical protein
VVCTGVDTTFLEVELSPNVNTNSLTADVITAAGIADNAFANEHFANGALTSTEITSAGGCVVASIAANAITATAIAADAIEAAKIKDDAITAAKIATDAIAADAFAQTAADKVWSTAARVLTANTNLSIPSAADVKTAIEADGSKLDHLWEMTEDDAGVRRFTANALEEAPSGGLDAAGVAAAVWDAVASSYDDASSMGALLNDAGAAGDPWDTALPGAYTSGKAGYILGTNLAAVYGATEKTAIDLLDDAAGGLADIHTDIGTLQTAVDGITAAVITNAAGADVAADIIAVKAVADLVEDIARNKMVITNEDGETKLYADNNSDILYTVAGCVVDNSTNTTRKRLE